MGLIGNMELNYTTYCRVMYTGYFIFSVLSFFRPEVMSGLDYYDWPRGASENDTKLLSACCGLLFLTGGAVYAAASQLSSEGSQRKFIQYSMIHPVTELFCIWRAWGSQPETRHESAAFKSVSVLAFALLTLYVFNKKAKVVSASGPKTMLYATRLFYVGMVLGACVFLSKSASMMGKLGFSESAAVEGYFCRVVCVHFLWAAAFMAAAQCGFESQKKFMQYSIVQPIVQMTYVMPLVAASVWNSGANGWMMAYFNIMVMWLRIVVPVVVCYPCTLRTMVLRCSWLFFGIAGWLHLYAPEVCGFLFMYKDEVEGAQQIGFAMVSLSFLYVAACRTDVGYSQLKIIEYTLCGDCAMLAVWAFLQKDMPAVLGLVAIKSVLIKAYDVVADYKGWKMVTVGGLFPTASMMKMKSG